METAKANDGGVISPDALRRKRRLELLDDVAVNRILEERGPAWVRAVASGRTKGDIGPATMAVVRLVGRDRREPVPVIRVEIKRPALSKHRPEQSAVVYILSPEKIVVMNRPASTPSRPAR